MGHALKPFKIKEGDRLPALEGAAVNRETGEPLNMVGATAVFQMRASGPAGAIVATGVATVVGATMLNDSGINLRYEWASGQTGTQGFYEGEFEIRYPGGVTHTVPGAEMFIPIRVTDSIA